MSLRYLVLGASTVALIVLVIAATLVFGLLWAATLATLVEYAVVSAKGESIGLLSRFVHHVTSQPLGLAILGFIILLPFTVAFRHRCR